MNPNEKFNKHLKIMAIVLVIWVVILILSIATRIRVVKPLVEVIPVVLFGYFIYATCVLFRKRNHTNKPDAEMADPAKQQPSQKKKGK